MFFRIKNLHRTHSSDALLQKSIHAGDLGTDDLKGGFYFFFENIAGNDQNGQYGHAHERQFPTRVEHDAQHGKQRQQIGNDGHHAFRKNGVNGFDVVDGAGGRSANGGAVEIRQAQAGDVPENAHPQIADDRLPQPTGDITEAVAEYRFHDQEGKYDHGNSGQSGCIAFKNVVVYHLLDQVGAQNG